MSKKIQENIRYYNYYIISFFIIINNFIPALFFYKSKNKPENNESNTININTVSNNTIIIANCEIVEGEKYKICGGKKLYKV